jgi:hypothetical protein
VDRVVTNVLSRWSIPALRVALGVVFVWFGALKIGRLSPVSELVARTVYWFDPDVVVPALGIVEVVIGAGLIFGVFLRVVLLPGLEPTALDRGRGVRGQEPRPARGRSGRRFDGSWTARPRAGPGAGRRELTEQLIRPQALDR